jgi:hypothetical protein
MMYYIICCVGRHCSEWNLASQVHAENVRSNHGGRYAKPAHFFFMAAGLRFRMLLNVAVTDSGRVRALCCWQARVLFG